MSIDERARLSLYQRLESVLGAEEADTMMSYLPPQGWGEVATKGDLALLRGDFDSFHRGMHSELRTQSAQLRVGLGAEIADVRSEIGAVRIELHRGLRSFVLSLVAVMVALAAGQMALIAAIS